MSSPAVRVRDLKVAYPLAERHVLNGVSFEVGRGELALVLGPTGSGKTTLLLTLAGVIPSLIPARVEGLVEVAGRYPTEEGLASLAGTVGIVFQDPESQYIMPTVLEEVYFPGENLAFPRDEVARRAVNALELVGLSGYRDHRVETLSTGLKQRLAIASVLALDPEVLLLDEPTAHIDMRSAREIYELLSVLKRSGKTVIVVEHRVELAEDIADKVIHIRGDGSCEVYPSLRDLVEKVGAKSLAAEGVWLPPEYAPAAQCREARGGWSKTAGNPARTPLVEARDLSVRFGGNNVLSGVNLEVGRGELVVVLGPNGSGKTTLLKVLAGVLRRYSGYVSIAGGPPHPSKVAFVAQVPELQFTERTVEEELASVLQSRGYKKGQALQRARELLRARGLGGLSGRVVYELSQGEKRLVSFLEMELLERSVYLLDEPTFGLDMKYSAFVVAEVERLVREGKTVILVTHDSWVLLLLNPKVYGLSQGRIVFEGDLRSLLLSRDAWEELAFRPPRYALKALEEGGLDSVISEHPARLRCLYEDAGA
uniref:ABC transporter ATP-binding protein n=1 Tax=Thermofilum pendens TaxID=2269 RepID=A0A7J3X8B4_THEPE